MINQKLLDTWFTHHPPTTGETVLKYAAIRDAGKTFAEVINAQCPDGPDKTVAVRKVREAVMVANASIACAVDGVDPATFRT